MKKIRLLSTLLLVASFGLAAAQTAGDYRSVVNGNWGTVGTWETYNGSAWVAAIAVPPVVPPYANITIQAGDTVIVEASPKRAASLKVEGTAMLYANSTTNRYVRLWGNVTNDGTVGASTDGLCYMCSTSVFINGMGSTDIARLQIAAANVSVTISSPIILHYAGAGLYGNNVDNVTYNVTGPSGQVDFGPSTYASITTNSSAPSPYNATYNLDAGSFKLQTGMNFNISVRSGKKSVLNLYTGLTLGDTLFAYSDSAGTEVVNLYGNGGITFSGMFNDTLRFDSLNNYTSFDYSPPSPAIVMGGLGMINAGYANSPSTNLRIGKNAIVTRGAGRFNAEPIFTDTFSVVYSGTDPCTTSYEMPNIEDNIVPNLTVGHELFVDTARIVNNIQTNDGPIVVSSPYYLGVMGSFNMNSANGYVVGTLGRLVPINAGSQYVGYDVGTSEGYTPIVVQFNNVTKAGLLACSSNDGEHGSAAVPQECLKRWWNLGWRPDSIALFDDCNLSLTYLPSDFNTDLVEATDELTMVAGKYDSGWAFPNIDNRDTANNTISVSGITSFSDFTLAKNQSSLAGDIDPPTIVSVSPAWGSTEVGLNEPIVIAFSEPMNTDSLDGYTDPFHDFTPSWNAAGDTFTLAPQNPYSYSTMMSVIITSGIDLAGNSLAVLPDTVVQFTTMANVGPSITLIQQPEDTYDGAGPFPVRAVFTDLGKAGIAADTLWYTDNATDWWALVHTSTDGDTFNYSIPGPLAAGTVIEFFFGAWDDGGTVQYDPGMFRGYQFRILDPLAPKGLNAVGGNLTVDLSWAPPAEVLEYSNSNGTGFFWEANDIITTRFTPQHYPCKVEQVVSSWWNAIGIDSVEVHVWADDGDGLPDRSVELVPPRVVLPLDYPSYTVVDISSDNLVLSSGDFHVGYVIRTDNYPMPMCDSDGPGIRSLVYDSSASTWGNMVNSGTYHDWSHQAAVSYNDYSKGLALKSFVPQPGAKPLPELSGIKSAKIAAKQTPVYPSLTGALFLAKNISGYDVLRGDASGGPYVGLDKVTDTTYTDNTVLNNNTYYYVVRALYVSPDTFSEYSNEASATPTGVAGKPESQVYTLQLKSVAPNPMTAGRTAFRFSLPVSAQASLEVFNVLGQKVNTLFDGRLEAGNHIINWNGTDYNGARLASGVYIYQLRTMGRTLTKRMTILR